MMRVKFLSSIYSSSHQTGSLCLRKHHLRKQLPMFSKSRYCELASGRKVRRDRWADVYNPSTGQADRSSPVVFG